MIELSRSRVGNATHLTPRGTFDSEPAVEVLRSSFDDCIENGESQIVLDLDGVAIVNSGALETLLEAQDKLAKIGGALCIAAPNALVSDVFRITRLGERIEVVDARSPQDEEAPSNAGPGPTPRIGEFLVAKGLVTNEQIEEALALQGQAGRRMAQILVDKGWLQEKDLLLALSEQLGVPFVWLRSGVFDPALVSLLDPDSAQRMGVMPLFQVHGVLYLATNDPQSIPMLETVEDVTQCRVEPVLACGDLIKNAWADTLAKSRDLGQYMGDLESDLELVETGTLEDDAAIDEMAAGSPVINLINGVVLRAVREGASDIHIEPSRTRSRIRFRMDGSLYTIMTPPAEVHAALVSRLKVMANLDIAERRLPQDGRIQVAIQGRLVDLRFSSLPGIFGEKVVLRVLDKNEAILGIDRLGLTESNLGILQKLLSRSYGLVLVTGPTGSGKTTTLYAALSHLSSEEKNIVTIEDPVEYQIDTINQNQTRDRVGLTFATILKHVLRQDPDIVMVGEIRERDTAEIAVQAALTGHLVLSTLHTNDSIGAITRMVDMGVEPFLLSSALAGVIAQRLVRRVCPECRTTYTVPAETLEQYGIHREGTIRLERGRGCTACYDSGYKGRRAIHELVEFDPELQRLIVSNSSRNDMDEYLRSTEMKTLRDDGIGRALAGETTVEEVLRVLSG